MTKAPQNVGPSGRRDEVLRVLRDARTPMSITDVAQQLSVHANTVRFHLETLIANGQVERTTATSRAPGRPAQLYRTTPGMDPGGPRHYRMLAEMLAAGLATTPTPGLQALEAGRSWGRARATTTSDADRTTAGGPVDRLVLLLDDMGFAPERGHHGDADQIGLHHCPFLELALGRSEVVCPVHLGLMQGALDAWGADITVDRLDPFVDPDVCVAHLAGTGATR